MSTLTSIKENLFYLARHNPLLFHLIKKLQNAEDFSPEKIARIKQERAKEMVKYALAHSSFYKTIYKGTSTESALASGDLSKLPVIYKANIRSHIQSIATAPIPLLKAAHTSGTSGTPLCVYRSPGSILRENAYIWYFKMTHGLGIGDPVISLRTKLDSNTLHYYNKSENVLYLSAYQLSKKNMPLYAKMINQFKPKAILAFPSSSYTLASLLEQEEQKVHIPLIFTSSETLYPFQREKMESVFSGSVKDYYGNVERSIAFGQCSHGSYHEMPLYSINEFTDNGVITTSLTNRSFPLIKYFVDDSFALTDSICGCGKQLTIKSIDGRVENSIRCPDGTIVTGMSMTFHDIEGLQYAQIIQDELPGIKVNLVTSPVYQEKDQEKLLTQLRKRVGESLKITINKVEEDQIIKSAAGKYTLVLSRLAKTQESIIAS
ncbi:MAG: hypothetical protein ABI415_08625 [Flavitalea sp.]